MRDENNIQRIETIEIETLLKKEHYRYYIALKDGAVSSIVKEVISRIQELERELKIRAEPGPGNGPTR